MEKARLGGQQFLELMRGGAANLRANAQTVNDLNVFPIPDGDTGENMMQTVSGGVNAANDCRDDSLGAVAQAIAHGMLLSARGNSGVILSQLFAGIARGLEDVDEADAAMLGFAFRSGVRRAYEAVMQPTEGTMLTVAREAVDYACARLTEESTLESFFSDCLQEMNASLQRTPELLAVLKEAGVIDSGGAGLVYLIDGMNRVLHGQAVEAGALSPAASTVDLSKFDEDSVMQFGYCTEFLLRLQRCKGSLENFSIDKLREELSALGDSIVAFRTGSIVKVHVHTMTPGVLLNHCQQYGEFLTLKIENMTLQHNESTVPEQAPSAPAAKEHTPFAVVTVADGAGVQEALRSLGADVVLDGGQGHNPSAEDFLHAFDRANADTIFVLPNNSNILLAAKQAAELYPAADVRVLESKDLGGGYAALTMLCYDSGDADEIAEEMRMAMDGAVTGVVTQSVRDAALGGIEIHENDYIGFSGKQMLAATQRKTDTALALLAALGAEKHEILIAVYGASVTQTEKEDFSQRVKAALPRTELYEIDGGQAVFDLELILE